MIFDAIKQGADPGTVLSVWIFGIILGFVIRGFIGGD